MGDFNINLLHYDHHTPTTNFINMMFSNNFQPSVLHPTRSTTTTSTLIDNIFINSSPDTKIKSGNILSLFSDHLPQFCIIYDCKFDFKASSQICYDYNSFDGNKFHADYAALDTSFLTDHNIDLDQMFDRFLLILNSLLNRHCSQKKLNKQRITLKNRPWINLYIQQMMKVRDRLYQKSKSSTSDADCIIVKLFQNHVVNNLTEKVR